MDERLCVDELATEQRVTRKTIYRWIATGRIPSELVHRDFGGRKYFLKSEIRICLLKAEEKDRMSQIVT